MSITLKQKHGPDTTPPTLLDYILIFLLGVALMTLAWMGEMG